MLKPEYRLLMPDPITRKVIVPLLNNPPDRWHSAVERVMDKKGFGYSLTEPLVAREKTTCHQFRVVSVREEKAFFGLREGVFILTDTIIDDEPLIQENRDAQMVIGKEALRQLSLDDYAMVSLGGWLGEKGVQGRRKISVLALNDFDQELRHVGWFELADRGFFLR